MSLYNMMNGVNPAAFFILPMLGEKHPDAYPRFRDCFVNTENGEPEIHVYTRVGGGNRNEGYGEEKLYAHPNYLTTWDDDFDCTFATYSFSVPAEWRKDFDLIMAGKLPEISKEYQQRIRSVFPKLNEKLDEMFAPKTPTP